MQCGLRNRLSDLPMLDDLPGAQQLRTRENVAKAYSLHRDVNNRPGVRFHINVARDPTVRQHESKKRAIVR